MRGLLKFVLLTLLLIGIGWWIMTIARSCNDPSKSTLDNVVDKTGEVIADGADAVEDGVRDLTGDDENMDDESDEFDDAEFDDVELDEDGDEVLDENETADEDEDDHDTGEIEDRTITSSEGSSSDDKYLVVSGSFLGEINANREVKRLKSMGYPDAEVVVFDFSQYYTVCVKRTNNLGEARGVKNQLGTKHNIEAYVHRRRSKRG